MEKEKDCVSTNSQSDSKETPSQKSVKKGNKHIQSQQAPQAHPSESQDHSPMNHHDPQTHHTKKKKRSSPSLPLTEMSKASVETELTHLLLTITVSFSSFTPSLFVYSFPFLFTSSLMFLSYFLLLSSLPTRSSLSQLLKKFLFMHRSVVPDHITFFPKQRASVLQSSLLQDSTGLSLPLILPTQNHLTIFCIPFLVILLFSHQSSSFCLFDNNPADVSTSCHALWCPLARPCNNSSILVPFSVSRIPSISCTKSILNPACPLFLPNHGSSKYLFSHFPKVSDRNFGLVHIPGIFKYLLLLSILVV